MLRVWNLSLVVSTFALTILGTFITRSGVLQSVHAFVESQIGPWFLTFFALIVIVSLGLIAWREMSSGRPVVSTRRSREARSWPTMWCSPASRSWCCSAPSSR